MPDPSSDETILLRRRNGAGAHANGNGKPGAANDDVTDTPARQAAPSSGAMPAFVGTLAALIVFAIIGVAAYFGYSALKSFAATKKSAPVAQTQPQPVAKTTHALSDPSTWELSAEPAQNLTADATPDIGWWTRTFDLPSQGKVTDYLKAQGITVSRLVPLHYDATRDTTTVTYQVEGEVPAQLLRVPKASWAPADPDLRPFASVVILDHNLPAGQFWNTARQSVAEQAGAKLDFAWKVQWDKTANTVSADRLPYNDDVFTPQQVAQFETETSDTVNQLRAQVQAIDARVQADVQARLAQVPANPPKPELMSTHWNHGDGSGEPTKSAERIGGGTVAGAAGGAAFGAAAGDAGMGAGIGAGVGLLGGFIYDTVSKNNDRHRYENHAAAVNAERMSEWRAQVRALDKQRDQVKQAGEAEKQQQIQELATRIAAAGGHVDAIPAPADTPAPAPAPSEAPPIQATAQPQTPNTYSDAPSAPPPADAPSGPIH
jgi:hypothetical protein